MVHGVGDQRHWRRVNQDWECRVMVRIDAVGFPTAHVDNLLCVDGALVVPFLAVGPEEGPLGEEVGLL